MAASSLIRSGPNDKPATAKEIGIPQHCLMCKSYVHSSNPRVRCLICKGLVHKSCLLYDDHYFYCGFCISSSLPFVNLDDDDDFFDEVGITNYTLKNVLSNVNDKLNLNPYEDLDDNFADHGDLDADSYHYNFICDQILGYCDSDQLNQFLPESGSVLQSIMHVNARDLKCNMDLLCCNLKTLKHEFSLIGISETWTDLSTESMIHIPGYDKIIRSRVGRKGGGVGLLINSNLNVAIKDRPDLECIDSSIFESLFVQISQPSINHTKDIIVGVVYRPPNSNVCRFIESFSKIIENIINENRPCYILGDFNIDLLKNNNYSQKFLNQLFSYGFYPKIDRVTRPASGTLIDNIFTNTHDTDSKSGIWIASIADHLPIYITIPNCVLTSAQPKTLCDNFIHKRLYTPENMSKFKSYLSSVDWSRVYNAAGTNNKYSEFLDTVSSAHDLCFPLTKLKINPRQESKPWITPSILKSIRKKNTMYKQYLKNRSSSTLLEKYKTYKNKLTSVLRIAEKDYYSTKLMHVKDNMGKTWKVINSMTNRNSNWNKITQIEVNNTKIVDPEIIADKFNKFFVNIGPELSNKIPKSNKNASEYLHGHYSKSLFFSPVIDQEIMDIISNLKNSTSTSHDNLPVKIIKYCNSELTPILAYLNNSSISEGVFPDLLKIAKIVPVFKAEDRQTISNYRPISILSPFSKIFEKIIFIRLNKYLIENSILHDSQFGFRSGLSTCMALLKLVDDISGAMDSSIVTVGVFIDLAKAFDTVDHEILLAKLNHYGIRGVVLNWFRSYLGSRQQYVTVNGCNSTLSPIVCGVPQGSILGPLLFLIYINDLNLMSNKLKSIMFADDTNLFISGKSLSEVSKQMNEEMIILSDWFRANLLSLNIKKTSFIIFSHKKNLAADIFIDNNALTRQYETKFLGVIITYNLNWKKHIEVVANKISKNIGIISKIRHLLPSTIIRTIYLTLVEPYISYCNLVWAQDKSTCALEKIFKIQKKYCRLITFSHYRSHSNPLFSKLSILTVFDIYKFQLSLYMYKIINIHALRNDFLSFQYNQTIHGYNTRHKMDIHQTCCRTLSRQKTVKFQGPKVWNNLPIALKQLPSLLVFKRKLKCYLLSSEFYAN